MTMRDYCNTLIYRNQQFECACGWCGDGSKAGCGEISRLFFELLCPDCQKVIAFVGVLTDEERVDFGQKYWDRLSESERREVEGSMKNVASFDRVKLTASSPLLDIVEEQFFLDWDDGGSGTAICHRGKVLWSEPSIYEGSTRFVEVAELLSKRYGARLLDLRPSKDSLHNLLGDDHRAIARLAECRARLFGTT